MPDGRESERFKSKIKEINQDMAFADKRLKRFRQAVEKIRQKNRQYLWMLGLESFEELEKSIKEQNIHPEGLNLFRNALAAKGIAPPEFLKKFSGSASWEEAIPGTAKEPVKKKKRVRIKL